MRCAELDVALRESDAQRRQLHDALQTLKGGVRVCARLKPGAGAIRADGLDGRRARGGADEGGRRRRAVRQAAARAPRPRLRARGATARFTLRWMPWSDRHLMDTTSACWLTVRRGRARPIRCLGGRHRTFRRESDRRCRQGPAAARLVARRPRDSCGSIRREVL